MMNVVCFEVSIKQLKLACIILISRCWLWAHGLYNARNFNKIKSLMQYRQVTEELSGTKQINLIRRRSSDPRITSLVLQYTLLKTGRIVLFIDACCLLVCVSFQRYAWLCRININRTYLWSVYWRSLPSLHLPSLSPITLTILYSPQGSV